MTSFDQLRIRLGVDGATDLNDEHVRYHLYLSSLDEVQWRVVAELLAAEPDPSLAESVFIQIVERVDAAHRQEVVESAEVALPQSTYAALRASELDLADQFESEPIGLKLNALRTSTLWVQLRVAGRTESWEVLRALADDGGSKRIKRIANDRLAAGR